MSKVLVDTSVWIDALNGKNTAQVQILNQLLEDDIPIVICPTIVQEILQGIKDDNDYRRVKDALSGFELLTLDALEAAYGAATLYRNSRKHGITIRKSNDCLIAYYAIASNAQLLHNDEDFNNIGRFSELSFWGA